MTWDKKGRVYAPEGLNGWDAEYAHLPTARTLTEQQVRVYFAALDDKKYGRIGCVDVDANDPARVLAVHPRPVLDLGEPGTFDDSGVNPSCFVEHSGRTYLYYIGWQRSHRVPYALFAGVAADEGDGLHFRRLSRTPVLDRTTDEPFLRSAVTILADNGVLRCWYVSALRWITVDAQPYPEYVIRYAESADGIDWKAYRHICIAVAGEEFGIGRPWVMKDGGLYKMWYSIRSRIEPYRIGYAESANGLEWTRKDELMSLPRSSSGWDSEMICYPCIHDIGSSRYMFYNGNRHGATGFGVALLKGSGSR